MKLTIYNLEKHKVGEKDLPAQFKEPFRPDLIKRAIHALQSCARQPYGSAPLAGQRASSEVSKRRRDYRGCYGFGISRVRRKILSKRGTRMFWVGATTPQTVGGRRAHPPKVEKIWEQKINAKENRKAIRSALAATVDKEIVAKRGHKLPLEYPFVLDASFEQINKTQQILDALLKLGFAEELSRSMVKKIRAGAGKSRGRRYQRKKGILLVVGGDCPLLKAARNIPGIEIIPAKAINAEVLAPGTMPGRVTLCTTQALEMLDKEKLFV